MCLIKNKDVGDFGKIDGIFYRDKSLEGKRAFSLKTEYVSFSSKNLPKYNTFLICINKLRKMSLLQK